MMSQNTIAIGVDLGGTMARAGLITAQGQLIYSAEVPIEAKDGPEAGIARLVELIGELKAKAIDQVIGIGIGATGPLDLQQGKIQNPYTLPGWEDVAITGPLEKQFGVPVYLENDADAAALGEYWLGAGQGVKRLAAVTVGTGVGMALILDGKIYRGLGDCHPEGGHMLLDPQGPSCYCGAEGCWESLCAGPAIVEQAKFLLKESPQPVVSLLKNLNEEEWTAARVIAEARKLDPIALKVVERAAFYMGLGIVNIINVFTPEKIVLSGGVMKSLDLFMPAIQRAIRKNNQVVPAEQVQVLPAVLGYYAGVYGSSFRVFQQFATN